MKTNILLMFSFLNVILLCIHWNEYSIHIVTDQLKIDTKNICLIFKYITNKS